ncbi:beta-ketoacyl-[acyl-carrier-protein] synthase family protein [Panacibacter sp. DH6]|uniref:Beta-ketoacyl-[acyl-carrier-protein] synthase family protein n=1 Tax=Panacibacter microcysteis TaxID=2793269 RepID=A0A931GXV1_9BACT|nr:beta-ketoacyl-[acyl-carrier-protein] synthase family protein [Panacibacter microcysteis]MBG9376664.1 beta-ketoacyl-[acyl-carrier-protein] synthase family protein [Panacibacter microcysteis]
MNSGVFVAGTGVVSAIGNNVAEHLLALEHGNAGMGNMTLLDSVHRSSLPVAEVKLSNKELAKRTGLATGITRTALLSALAAQEAVNDAAIDLKNLRTGFISANSVGGMDKTENFYAQFLADTSAGRLRNVVNHECGRPTEIVADLLGISHFVTTISTACSSSANAVFLGARMIRHNLLDVAVAGGADALTKFTLNGFNSLMILDNEFCKPFDENRKGLNLGEGAGYIVLVSEKIARQLPKDVYCAISGWANANDAYHQTASSPAGTGSLLAMNGALHKAGIQPSAISYINLHGTGTQNNDIAEGTAINTLFAPHFPKLSSTKSFTGHTLGACGGVEAVFSALSVRHGLVYPNLRFHTQMKELPFAPQTVFLKNQQISHVMSNSFGFGGNCSSLIFSKV